MCDAIAAVAGLLSLPVFFCLITCTAHALRALHCAIIIVLRCVQFHACLRCMCFHDQSQVQGSKFKQRPETRAC